MIKAWRILILFLLVFGVSLSAYANGFSKGDYGQDVIEIQTKLNSLGFDTGGIDGAFGSITMSAVKSFQQSKGIAADGVVGEATYRALMERDFPVSRDDVDTSAARRIVQTAMKYVGTRYAFGGSSPGGFDCSGFVRYVFSNNGIHLPRMADQQYGIGRSVSYSNLQIGDTVYFSTYTSGISHVGIYVGNGSFIHSSSSRGVIVSQMSESYWSARYVGARRIL